MFGGRGTRARLRSSIASGSAVGWIQALRACAREVARRATHVHARVHHAVACIRARVHAAARTRAPYVTAWLGARIQRAQLARRTQKRRKEEAEDRIDSPVTQTRDRATTSLCLEQKSRRASAKRCARKIKLSLRLGAARRCGGKRQIHLVLRCSSVSSRESDFPSFRESHSSG